MSCEFDPQGKDIKICGSLVDSPCTPIVYNAVGVTYLNFREPPRCEDMLERGLLVETADLLVKGTLDPASPAGRAIGYRQAIDFLCASPTEAVSNGKKKVRGNDRGIGAVDDTEARRFLEFYGGFAAKTRQYAGEQMKWFRSPKGHDFSWQAWDLGGTIVEAQTAKKPPRGNFFQVSTPMEPKRAGDGRSWQDVVVSILESFVLPRESFAAKLDGEEQTSLRRENERRAKDMKHYVPGVTEASLGDNDVLRKLVHQAEGLSAAVREAHHQRQYNWAETGVEKRVKGWHAGSR